MGQGFFAHLFLSHRAARELRESRAIKTSPQWVVILAKSPRTSISRTPCRAPLLEGQSFIFVTRSKRKTFLR